MNQMFQNEHETTNRNNGPMINDSDIKEKVNLNKKLGKLLNDSSQIYQT